MHKIAKALTVSSMSIALASCGGGSGGGSGYKTPAARPDGTIKGIVTDSVVSGATVDFYRYIDAGRKEFLAESVTTNSDGRYTQKISGKDGYVLIIARGGSYTEEYSGEVIQLEKQHVLKALSHYQSSRSIDIIPNPWSTVAFGYAECRINNGNLSVGNALSESLDIMSAIVGVPVLSTYPINPTHISNAHHNIVDDGLKFGAIAAGMSKWTYDEAVSQGLEPHSPGLRSIDLASSMYEDVKSDCVLDGLAVREDGTKYSLAFGKRPLDTNVYRTEFPRKTLEFMNSDKNKTSLRSADLALYANNQATSTAKIFGNTKPTALDATGPVLALSLADGDYIFGKARLIVNASDISGVSSVKVQIGDEIEEVVSGIESVIEFHTKQIPDGPIEVSILAEDSLSNITNESITLNVQNASPIFELVSPSVVNTETYSAKVAVSNIPQGIKTAYLNGVPALVDGNTLSADTEISQGKNFFSIKLIDSLGKTHETSKDVFLDIIEPVVQTVQPSDHIDGSFLVNYLDEGWKKPQLKPFLTSETSSIYVPKDRQNCGSVLQQEAHLKAVNWPYAAVAPLDSGKWQEGKMTDIGLDVTYSYSIGDKNIVSNAPVIRENGIHFVPFCSEYLGDNWWQIPDGLTASISFDVKDKAGNNTSHTYSLKFSDSPTAIEIKSDDQTYVGKESANGFGYISFDAIGMETIERIELYIDGSRIPYPVNKTSGRIGIPAGELSDGLHELYLVAYEQGGTEALRTEPVKFRVDNTAPSIELSSKRITGKAQYVAKFKIADGSGSGFDEDSLVVKNQLEPNSSYKEFVLDSDGYYTVVVNDLKPGINPLIVNASDKVGNSKQVVFADVGRDISPPFIKWHYPNSDNPRKVLGYKDGDIITQPFLVQGTGYPVYLDDKMVNLKGAAYQDYQNYIIGNRSVTIPHLAFNTYDRADKSPLGKVEDTNIIAKYEVYVDGHQIFSRELKEESQTFRFDGFIPTTREFLGDEFMRTSGQSDVKIKVILTDHADHEATYEAKFKVYFEPGAPIAKSLNHEDINSLMAIKDITNASQIQNDFGTHNLTINNPKSYPVWISLEDQSDDRVTLSSKQGRLVNMFREVYSYERKLVKGFKVEKGNGADPNYYMVEKQFPESAWSTDQVFSGSTKDVYLVPENQNRIEMPYRKQFRNAPEPRISAPAFLPIHASGVLEFDQYQYSPSSNVDCRIEPDFCWWKLSEPKIYTVQGSFKGVFLDDQSLQYRKHTTYEVMEGYPQPELIDQSYAGNAVTHFEVHDAKENTRDSNRDWYLIEPGESLSVTRKVRFQGNFNAGDCDWSYDAEKSCLVEVAGNLGGTVKVYTRINTLDNKIGQVEQMSSHKLEPITFKISR